MPEADGAPACDLDEDEFPVLVQHRARDVGADDPQPGIGLDPDGARFRPGVGIEGGCHAAGGRQNQQDCVSRKGRDALLDPRGLGWFSSSWFVAEARESGATFRTSRRPQGHDIQGNFQSQIGQ